MRTFLWILFFGLFFEMQAQPYLVKIGVEDAFSFEPVRNAYVKIVQGDREFYYKTGDTGEITVALEGKVRVEMAHPAYKHLRADFDVKNDMEIGFLAESKAGYTVEEKPDVFLEMKILDAGSHKEIPSGKITIFANAFTFSSDFEKGRFVLNKQSAPGWWKELPAETEITYYVEAPGYENFLQTDLIPQVYTVKAIKLKPEKSFRAGKTVPAKPVKKVSDDVKRLFEDISAKTVLQTACDRLPSTIRVGVNCNCNDCQAVQVMSLQVYVKQGLNDEWIASWHMESLKAGSLPYRTYGAYYVLHPVDANYDISNTTCKQVWDSDYSSRCYSAADATDGEYLETAGGAIAFSEYSAENNCLNPSSTYPCNCGDGYAGNGTDWPCIQDQVCAGHDRYGHGRGMCQWGSSRWANNGQPYTWIANHYYNPGGIYRCGTTHPHPDFEVTSGQLSQSSGSPGDLINASCVVENNTGYRTDKNVLRAYLSTDVHFDSSDVLLDTTVLWPINPSASVTKNLSFNVPNVPAGNYYVLLIADPDDTMYETDETNNVQAISFTVNTTAVEENELTENLLIYPNPVRDELYIEVTGGYQLYTLLVTDLTGRVIKEWKEVIPKKIDMRNWGRGTYIFKLKEKKGLEGVYKIVKF